MTQGPPTMGHMERNRLMAYALQVVLDQGGDEDAVFAVVEREFAADEDDLQQASMFAAMGLELYEMPGDLAGPSMVRKAQAWYARRAEAFTDPVRPSAWWRRKRTA